MFDEEPIEVPESPEEVFQRGYVQGRQAAEDVELAALTDAIQEIAAKLEEDRASSLSQRQQAIRALMPILRAILDTIGPIGERERLETLLTKELSRIVEQAPYRRCTIRCSPDLAARVGDIIAASADPSLLRIDEDPECQGLDIGLDGGIIAFDATIVMARLRQHISNIFGEEDA